MKLNASDLMQLCQHAMSAARQAGQIISEYMHRPISATTKKCGSSPASQVVTEVDLSSQNTILKSLIPTCATFDLALLTEENPDNLKRLEKDFFWCIDPLDGTLPFIESTPGYAVSIALVSRNGIPHIGVIFDPVEQTLYHAVKEVGAFRNGKPWALKTCKASPEQSLTLIIDRSFEQHRLFATTLAELENIASKIGYGGLKTILYGGAVMNACWVLENVPACYFKFPKSQKGGGSLWDYAASTCLFNEIDALASDIYGDPLDLNRPDSTFMNHRGVLYASDQDTASRIMDLYAQLHMD